MQKEKVSPEKCKHKNWLVLSNSEGSRNGISQCQNCDLWLTHAERLSWEVLKNQKFVSKISMILSVTAIIVSIVSFFIDKCNCN